MPLSDRHLRLGVVVLVVAVIVDRLDSASRWIEKYPLVARLIEVEERIDTSGTNVCSSISKWRNIPVALDELYHRALVDGVVIDVVGL